LQLCEANPSFKLNKREKKGEEKNLHQSSIVSWMPTCVGPQCGGRHDTSNAITKDQQRPLGDAS